MFDRETLIMIAVLFFYITENVENHGNCPVPDRVNAQLQASGICLHQARKHCTGRIHLVTQETMIPRLIRKWLEHVGRARAERTICKAFYCSQSQICGSPGM